MTQESLYRLAFFLYNIIQWLIWYWAVSRLFKPRLALVWVCLLETALAATGIWLDAYPMAESKLFGTMSFFLFFMAPAVLLHEGKVLRKVIFAFLMVGTVMATELVMSFLSPAMEMAVARREFYDLSVLYFYLEYLSCQFLLCVAVMLGFRSLEKRAGPYLTDRNKLLFLLFPVSQYVLLTGWYLNFVTDLSRGELLAALAVTVFCAASDVFLYRLVLKVADNARLQARNELMQQQVQAQSDYYHLLAESYGDMSRLRHDVDNHIYTIRALLADGKPDDAMAYADQLQHSKAVQALGSDCRNTVVRAFLLHRHRDLTAKGIRCEGDVVLPARCGVADIDLIIALGNLLDNAAEACTGTDGPYIRLKALAQDGIVHIETENSCTPSAQAPKKQRRIPYLDRGIGSAILQSLAEKYHGSYRMDRQDTVCRATLVLKEELPHENRDL